MTEADRVPWLQGVHRGGRSRRTRFRVAASEPGVADRTEPSVAELEDAVVRLRRQAVSALARQEELRSQLAACREQAGPVEREAAWAFARGEERLALQILYRELPVLGRRDLLQLELVELRRRVIQLLKEAARLDERARGSRKGEES